MKKRFIKVLCISLALTLLCSVAAFAGQTPAADRKLRFGADGKFTVMQIADTQDILFPRSTMIEFIGRALDEVQPDLVVFTGDNTEDITFFTASWKPAIEWIVAPLVERDIPFTFTFGNHDAVIPAGKEALFKQYLTYDNCLAYDADPKTYGTGNHNLPIYASAGEDVKFNLWVLDSNAYDFSRFNFGNLDLSSISSFDDIAPVFQTFFNIPYDNVHEDQIAWFKKTNDALTAAAGHKVPSLVFQHIIVPEVSELLLQSAPGDTNTKGINGKDCALKLDPAKATGYLGEFPCPPAYNGGEFTALKESGSVLGIVTGHDHVNSFIGKVDGIDLIQSAGVGFASYGNDEVRGVRVITLNEANPGSYETDTLVYADLFTSEADLARYEFGQGAGGMLVTALASLLKLFGLEPLETIVQLGNWFADLFG